MTREQEDVPVWHHKGFKLTLMLQGACTMLAKLSELILMITDNDIDYNDDDDDVALTLKW